MRDFEFFAIIGRPVNFPVIIGLLLLFITSFLPIRMIDRILFDRGCPWKTMTVLRGPGLKTRRRLACQKHSPVPCNQ